MNWKRIGWYLIGIWLVPLLEGLVKLLESLSRFLERHREKVEGFARKMEERKKASWSTRVLGKLDDWLIDNVFQPTSDWWRNRTGKSNFWVAKMFAWLGLIIASWNVIANIRIDYVVAAYVVVSGIAFCAFMFRLITIMDKDAEDIEQELEATRTANPVRLLLVDERTRSLWNALLWVCMTYVVHETRFYSPFFWSAVFWVLAYIPVLYFMSCTPKPRSPLKAGNELAAQAINSS
ncbi:hypothetical protein A2763_02875 [Candidatus Kaiserbacteria bacterium RIFCSPHIGHO2_01_FULL_54_36]|uniref:Uncharacterized protein n=1 Tax=Candidatus Kaiserbacteria bacterium RIFCSPHIGHO2_01_FULL_54_36 TaxID=1798482 RepID=A0A1F6CPL2_9BACT|nr:MAG: hypothetical protein A2763_02875 [Candidatus Kaiserbacteria bacterium RIFCSPHIGHO2_01_FULL_54_36]OGG75256.1 MAG: hypothetical protein A3A41_04015 [Candidatus Kaiserbacteria bacterium RIFCSPLOWO2_01_FULL_54_22]